MEVAPSMTISPNFLKTLGQNLKEPTSAFADFADNADDAFAKELHIWIDADHEWHALPDHKQGQRAWTRAGRDPRAAAAGLQQEVC